MARKRAKSRQQVPWNKGVQVGQREPFSPTEVSRIRKSLAKRGDAGRRDLALFTTAIDTMLRARDLLDLSVQDVRKRNRVMRDLVELDICTTGQGVECTLSKVTMNILNEWIDWSGKGPREYLFTAQHGSRGEVISPRQLNRLVKAWAEGIGLDASLYGTESLRRTRAMHVLNKTGNMEAARILLGLSDIRATSLYLREADPVDALAISRKHEL